MTRKTYVVGTMTFGEMEKSAKALNPKWREKFAVLPFPRVRLVVVQPPYSYDEYLKTSKVGVSRDEFVKFSNEIGPGRKVYEFSLLQYGHDVDDFMSDTSTLSYDDKARIAAAVKPIVQVEHRVFGCRFALHAGNLAAVYEFWSLVIVRHDGVVDTMALARTQSDEAERLEKAGALNSIGNAFLSFVIPLRIPRKLRTENLTPITTQAPFMPEGDEDPVIAISLETVALRRRNKRNTQTNDDLLMGLADVAGYYRVQPIWYSKDGVRKGELVLIEQTVGDYQRRTRHDRHYNPDRIRHITKH